MKLQRAWLEELVFSGEVPRRFTQDSPILPDVWLAYGEAGRIEAPLDLLLTPFRNTTPGQLALQLQDMLVPGGRARAARSRRRTAPGEPRAIASNQSVVAARLPVSELIRVSVCLSPWWAEHARPRGKTRSRERFVPAWLARADWRAAAAEQLAALAGRQDREDRLLRRPDDTQPATPRRTRGGSELPPSFLWFVRVVGTVLLGLREREPTARAEGAALERFRRLAWSFDAQLREFASLLGGVEPAARRSEAKLFMVSRNRDAELALDRSVPTVKADAAIRLFKIDCSRLTWAVVDCGVDATHPAFRTRDAKGKLEVVPRHTHASQCSRVRETYDFTRVRYLLNPSMTEAESRIADLRKRLRDDPRSDAAARWRRELEFLRGFVQGDGAPEEAKKLRSMLLDGRVLDWDLLLPFLRVEHGQDYEPPVLDHGTHVAGILAGDWRSTDGPEETGEGPGDESLVGMCPDMSLVDLRVVSGEGGDEFAVMAAMQFVRWLNARSDQPAIHGTNLSLAIRHDVTNFACGRTPVCDECTRVVHAGVVVVAAAGNEGRAHYLLASGGSSEGYRGISVADPGNAEDVITVGATHRHQPHTYGVSYFSSRGPTGDGRSKPDLVAPGEKITAPVPGPAAAIKDGTSMAAPHVSGAAALLMARHRELQGQPQRVKQILCDTATDLGRERYFQGHGLVDVLRAIQSV
jgi:subtilisin family serine protease